MKKSNSVIIAIVSLLLMSSIMTGTVTATKGWVQSEPHTGHHTASKQGSVKICGDHKCAGFEYEKMQKSLRDLQKQNQADHLKQNPTKK